MIKELTPTGFIAEDTTDEIEIVYKTKTNIKPDDIIAITGTIRENKLYADDIIFPDIPINREITKFSSTFIFTHKYSEKINNEKYDLIFTTNEKNKKTINITTNPFKIEIEKPKKLNILVYKPDNISEPKDAITLLKKRHLSQKEGEIPLKNDPFLIKETPDIFWLISENKWTENYKGVTLFSCDPSHFAEINMETREVVFKEL